MRVRGDSMYPDFRNGDIVLVLKQSTMNHSGEIGVISYGDDEMTIKRINYVDGSSVIGTSAPISHGMLTFSARASLSKLR